MEPMLRWLTAGESHGPALVAILEGVPAGVQVTTEDLAGALARRRAGYGRGARMSFEQDEVDILGGVRHGVTMGSPIAVSVGNTEWPKWDQVMSPNPVDPDLLADLARNTPLTRPRPGHADLVGMQKYAFDDARNVLERASARETAARVAAGTLAKLLLAALGAEIVSHVIQMGAVRASSERRPIPADLPAVDDSPVRCFDPAAEAMMIAAVEAAAKDGDSLGGVVEVLGYGVPQGLGSHVHWDRKIDGLLAQALMSIQAMKGVELGDGFEVAGLRGSEAHDEILWDAASGEYRRGGTRAGGTEGGMTTGGLLAV